MLRLIRDAPLTPAFLLIAFSWGAGIAYVIVGAGLYVIRSLGG